MRLPKSLYNENGRFTATRLGAAEIYFSKDFSYFFSLCQKTQFYGGGGERDERLEF